MRPNVRALLSAVGSAFRRERLPPPPEAVPSVSHPRTGLLAMLFAIEPLPRDPVVETPPRGRWLRWLFAPETLDP